MIWEEGHGVRTPKQPFSPVGQISCHLKNNCVALKQKHWLLKYASKTTQIIRTSAIPSYIGKAHDCILRSFAPSIVQYNEA